MSSSASDSPGLWRWFMIVSLTGISIAILVAGRNFLVPLIVGILVFVLMSAAIEWVTRIRQAIRVPASSDSRRRGR